MPPLMAGQYFINQGSRTATNVPWLREANPDTIVPSLENRPQAANIPMLPAFGGVEALRGGSPTTPYAGVSAIAGGPTAYPGTGMAETNIQKRFREMNKSGSQQEKSQFAEAPYVKEAARQAKMDQMAHELAIAEGRGFRGAQVRAEAAVKAADIKAGTALTVAEKKIASAEKIKDLDVKSAERIAIAKNGTEQDKIKAQLAISANELAKKSELSMAEGKQPGTPAYQQALTDQLKLEQQKGSIRGANDLNGIMAQGLKDIYSNPKNYASDAEKDEQATALVEAVQGFAATLPQVAPAATVTPAAPAAEPKAEVKAPVSGDLNNDGVVNAEDIRIRDTEVGQINKAILEGYKGQPLTKEQLDVLKTRLSALSLIKPLKQ